MEGPGRRRLVRVGHVPASEEPRAPRRHRAHRHRQQGPLRPGAHAPAAARRTSHRSRRRPRSPGTSSSRPPPTCGRSRRRAPRASVTLRRSRSQLPSASSTSTRTRATSCSIPFMGSGSTAVAAVRTDRHYVGYDTDDGYVASAGERIDAELARLRDDDRAAPERVRLPAVTADEDVDGDAVARALREGHQVKDLARAVLDDAGFAEIRPDVKLRKLGVDLGFVAVDHAGEEWAFDVSGAISSSHRAGLRRTDAPVEGARQGRRPARGPARPHARPAHHPRAGPGSAGYAALQAVTGAGRPVFDTVELLEHPRRRERLRVLRAAGSHRPLTCPRTARSSPSWRRASACSATTDPRTPCSADRAEMASLARRRTGTDLAELWIAGAHRQRVRRRLRQRRGRSSTPPTRSRDRRRASSSGRAGAARPATRSCRRTSASTTSTS